jgi:hypothetical protein
VLSAATAFVEAMNAGDERALLRLTWAWEESAAQKIGRQRFARLVAAEKKLERAAAQRFGEEGKRLGCGFELVFSRRDQQSLLAGQVVIREGGRSAVIIRKTDPWPIRMQRRGEGPWQVVLDFIDTELEDETPTMAARPAAATAARLAEYEATAALMETTATRVEKGDYGNAGEAEVDLAERLAAMRAGRGGGRP